MLTLRTHLNIFSALVIEGTLNASDSKYKDNKQYVKKIANMIDEAITNCRHM